MTFARLIALGAFAMIAASAIGCDLSRFPVCKSDAECGARDGGADEPVCYNLKCVECRYDDDFAVGSICLSTNVSQGISAPKEQDKGRRRVDPKTWDECAEACQDSDCIASCNRRFSAP